MQSGLWGFLRGAINEYPAVDFRLLDSRPISPPRNGLRASRRPSLWAAVNSNFQRRRRALPRVRMRRGLNRVEAARSQRARSAEIRATGPPRELPVDEGAAPRPARGEVEIEVSAVGLNFRDILVGLGISRRRPAQARA